MAKGMAAVLNLVLIVIGLDVPLGVFDGLRDKGPYEKLGPAVEKSERSLWWPGSLAVPMDGSSVRQFLRRFGALADIMCMVGNKFAFIGKPACAGLQPVKAQQLCELLGVSTVTADRCMYGHQGGVDMSVHVTKVSRRSSCADGNPVREQAASEHVCGLCGQKVN